MRKSSTYLEAPRPFAKRAAGPLLIVLVMFYLMFHAVSGERGVFALFTETRRLAVLKAELAEVHAKREALEHKVQLLSRRSLDLDLLDEQVRRILGMTGKDEVKLPKGIEMEIPVLVLDIDWQVTGGKQNWETVLKNISLSCGKVPTS